MNRTNFAPTARTIVVALGLMVVGLLGTYGTIVSDMIGDPGVRRRRRAAPPGDGLQAHLTLEGEARKAAVITRQSTAV